MKAMKSETKEEIPIMARPRFIDIDGRRYLWRDLVQLYHAQRQPAAEHPALFPLRDDCRPLGERTAAERYREPSLFIRLDG